MAYDLAGCVDGVGDPDRLVLAMLKPTLRRWTCPLCWRHEDAYTPPLGWLVVEPFARVAACDRCRDRFDGAKSCPAG